MKNVIFIATTLLYSLSLCVEAREVADVNNRDNPGAENPLGVLKSNTGLGAAPGDLYFRTADQEYIKINKDNYGVIVKNVSDATVFGRMEYKKKTYYITNSGKYAGYYLSYSSKGYIGTYGWINAVAWKKDDKLCLTVDNNKLWKTYEYEKDKKTYVVIGDYKYTEKCFLPVPATESYQPIKLQAKYNNENAACSWQPAVKCPPYVTYFTDSQSATLALTVNKGKLYQGNGLFDTSGADASHSLEHTSIFVMDLHGVIYASKQFKPYMFHHSTILAGRDVAFAGEMQVVKGIIKKVTNCSGHYIPKIELAKQLKDSLNRQGYTEEVSVDECKPRFFDFNYNELTSER